MFFQWSGIMRERKERLTSKHIEDLKIATMALEGELMLPGGSNPRKNSREQRLLDMAEQGEETSAHYKALLAVNIKKYQEDTTPTKLQKLVSAYYWHAYHLSVLRLYYHYCTVQAPTLSEKRIYSQSAMAKSDALLQQIDCVLALHAQESEEYTQAIEEKTEYSDLHNTIKTKYEQLLPRPKLGLELGKSSLKRAATASNTDGTLFIKHKKVSRNKVSDRDATLEPQANDGMTPGNF